MPVRDVPELPPLEVEAPPFDTEAPPLEGEPPFDTEAPPLEGEPPLDAEDPPLEVETPPDPGLAPPLVLDGCEDAEPHPAMEETTSEKA